MAHDGQLAQTMPRSAATEIVLADIRKSFNRADVAVEIDHLRIRPGEFLTLVGPSGCGKTTTMRMIAGLEDPTEGRILFDSRVVNDVSVQKRNVAMVFQNYALYPHMRVAANLDYGLRKRGVPRAERAERVAWVAQLLRIERLLERRPRELSGGEQQRVALGRAIIRTPDVLLLDEPLSNLDAKLRTFMRGELVKLQRAIGCTTVFVTHDQLEAMTMSDRIAVMNGGRIEQFAASQEIYDRPGTLFVAGFMGSPPMNLLEGELSGEGDGFRFRARGLDIALAREDCNGLGEPIDRRVTLGIRPEHIRLDGESGNLQQVVTLVELIGSEKHVFLESEAGALIARENAEARIEPGARLFVQLERRKIRLFSTTTGKALS